MDFRDSTDLSRFNIVAQWEAPKNIVAFTTTRANGQSKPPFDSLNLGDHVGDDNAHVQQNRASLISDYGLPGEPRWLSQTHSTIVRHLDEGADCVDPADGAISNIAGVVCVVLTADCLPLFLCNDAGTKVGVIHAGWQGLANGIVEQGVLAMGEAGDQLHAWAGPTISNKHFEIGNQVREQLGGSSLAYRDSANTGKCFADLYQLVRERLQAVGVKKYTHSQHCTFADSKQFFSHRRGRTTGRMASIIYIK